MSFPIPEDTICGVGGCCYTPHADGPHTWQERDPEWEARFAEGLEIAWLEEEQ